MEELEEMMFGKIKKGRASKAEKVEKKEEPEEDQEEEKNDEENKEEEDQEDDDAEEDDDDDAEEAAENNNDDDSENDDEQQIENAGAEIQLEEEPRGNDEDKIEVSYEAGPHWSRAHLKDHSPFKRGLLMIEGMMYYFIWFITYCPV